MELPINGHHRGGGEVGEGGGALTLSRYLNDCVTVELPLMKPNCLEENHMYHVIFFDERLHYFACNRCMAHWPVDFLKWIESFFTGRTQVVKVNASESESAYPGEVS